MSDIHGIHNLFRNYQPSSVDPERESQLVIKTVLTSGTWEQILWLFRRYGRERVRQMVLEDDAGLRSLPDSVLVFWRNIFLPDAPAPQVDPVDRWRPTRHVPVFPTPGDASVPPADSFSQSD